VSRSPPVRNHRAARRECAAALRCSRPGSGARVNFRRAHRREIRRRTALRSKARRRRLPSKSRGCVVSLAHFRHGQRPLHARHLQENSPAGAGLSRPARAKPDGLHYRPPGLTRSMNTSQAAARTSGGGVSVRFSRSAGSASMTGFGGWSLHRPWGGTPARKTDQRQVASAPP